MKHIKTFEQHIVTTGPAVNELFGLSAKEKEAKAANRERLGKQLDDIYAKMEGKKWSTASGGKAPDKEILLNKADKEDGCEGNFIFALAKDKSGLIQYNSKQKGLQGKTGGSSGMGTANG